MHANIKRIVLSTYRKLQLSLIKTCIKILLKNIDAPITPKPGNRYIAPCLTPQLKL